MPFNGGEEPWPAGSPPRRPQEPSAFRARPSTGGSAGPSPKAAGRIGRAGAMDA